MTITFFFKTVIRSAQAEPQSSAARLRTVFYTDPTSKVTISAFREPLGAGTGPLEQARWTRSVCNGVPAGNYR